MLVSARRLRDLKAAPEDVEIETIEAVERTARALQEPYRRFRPTETNDDRSSRHYRDLRAVPAILGERR